MVTAGRDDQERYQHKHGSSTECSLPGHCAIRTVCCSAGPAVEAAGSMELIATPVRHSKPLVRAAAAGKRLIVLAREDILRR